MSKKNVSKKNVGRDVLVSAPRERPGHRPRFYAPKAATVESALRGAQVSGTEVL